MSIFSIHVLRYILIFKIYIPGIWRKTKQNKNKNKTKQNKTKQNKQTNKQILVQKNNDWILFENNIMDFEWSLVCFKNKTKVHKAVSFISVNGFVFLHKEIRKKM